jgi:hypothetical protein
MGGLTSPPVLSVGSSAGQVPEAAAAATNLCTDGYNIGFKWTVEGAPAYNAFSQWDNGFVPVGLQTPNGVTSRLVSAVLNLYTTTSVPALLTDRINCFSVYATAWNQLQPSPQCRFEATLLPSGKVVSLDINPINGVLIAQAGNPASVAVERIVCPLLNKVENVALYRLSFALDVGTDTTAQLRCYPRTDGIAAGVAVFGGAQVEGMVSHPSPFVSAGTRNAGNAPRQVSIPNMQQRVLNVGVYNVDAIADQDTWLQCNLLAGNTVALPSFGATTPDMPAGSRLLITQSATAIGGITTVQSAGPNTIIAPGGITAAYTNLTFPSTDFPNVTQMMLVKTDVQNQWMILSTSAGGSGSGGLFLQAGAGAVARTFQDKDRDTVSVFDYMTSAQIADVKAGTLLVDVTTPIQTAINTGFNVFFPKGSYLITTALSVTAAGQSLYGESKASTRIAQNSVGEHGIFVNNAANAEIRGLFVYANGANTKSGIYVSLGNYALITDVYVTNFNNGFYGLGTNQLNLINVQAVNNLNDGILIETAGTANVGTVIENVYSAGNGTGAAGNGLSIVGNVSGIYVRGASLEVNKNSGLFINSNADGQPTAGFFSQLIIDSNVVNGANIAIANTLTFTGNWYSNRGTGDNLLIDAGSADIRLIGEKIYFCAKHGIRVLGARTQIIGVSVEDASTGAANTFDGIFVDGASAVNTLISGTRVNSSRNTTRYGVHIGLAPSNTRVIACDLTGNVSGDYINDSQYSYNAYFDDFGGVSGAINNGATATLLTLPGNQTGNYLFFAGQHGAANGGIRAMAHVRLGTGTIGLTSIVAVGGATFVATGGPFDVQITNTAGGPVTFDWSYIRVP